MGALWEILQTGMMYGQYKKSGSVEERVEFLEKKLLATQETLQKLVKKIEEIHGMDIDGDGRIG